MSEVATKLATNPGRLNRLPMSKYSSGEDLLFLVRLNPIYINVITYIPIIIESKKCIII